MNTSTKVLTWLASMLLTTSAWAQVSSIEVGSGVGLAGETGIVIPVNLTANGDNIAGIDMSVTFTTATQYSNLDVDCGVQTVSASVFASCSVAANVVTIQIAETAGQAWTSGLLANITVDVDAAAVALVDDPLAATIVGASNNAGTDIPFPTTTDGAFTVTVVKADQVITDFISTPAIGTVNGTSTLSATASSGLAVTFGNNTPAICTIDVDGITVTYQAAGICTVTADQAGDDAYNAATQETLNIVVAKADQTITGFVAVPATGTVGGTSTLSATASSGLTVDFGRSTPLVCTVVGTTVTFNAGGTCTVTANQVGDDNYNPATQVTLDIGIDKTDQTITGLAADPAAGVVDGTSALSATASSGLTVDDFGSSTPGVCIVLGSTVTYQAAGTCTVTADQAGDDDFNAAPQVSIDIIVAMADQDITAFIATPGFGFIDGASLLSAAGGGSGEPVIFGSNTPLICIVVDSIVSYIAVGTCTVTADQAGDDNYNDAPQITLDINVTEFAPIQAEPIPTLSQWGLVLLLLLMLSMGGIVIRRKDVG
jgi:hypothetical protein